MMLQKIGKWMVCSGKTGKIRNSLFNLVLYLQIIYSQISNCWSKRCGQCFENELLCISLTQLWTFQNHWVLVLLDVPQLINHLKVSRKHRVKSMTYEKDLLYQIFKLIMKLDEIKSSWCWNRLIRGTEYRVQKQIKCI